MARRTARKSLVIAGVGLASLAAPLIAVDVTSRPVASADPVATPSASSWGPRAPMALERQELYPEVVGRRIYVAGGLLNPNTGVSAHFDAYDPAADRWEQLATLPDARHHIGLAEAGGLIYGTGGFTGGFPRWQAQADTYVYDPATDQWRHGVDLPRARAEAITESVKDKVYVIGGRVRNNSRSSTFADHSDSRRNEMFDPATGRWRTLSPAPTARNSAGSAVIAGLIYVVGGRQFSLDAAGNPVQTNLDTVEVYNPRTDTWRTRAPMPEARGGLAVAALGGYLYAFGGELQGPQPQVYGDVFRYNPRTDQWKRVSSLPTPRHGLGAATVGTTIYTFGGGTRAGGNFASDLTEAYTPGSSAEKGA